MLEADGVVDRIGADHIHGNVHRAVEAQLAEDASDGARCPIARDRSIRSGAITQAEYDQLKAKALASLSGERTKRDGCNRQPRTGASRARS